MVVVAPVDILAVTAAQFRNFHEDVSRHILIFYASKSPSDICCINKSKNNSIYLSQAVITLPSMKQERMSYYFTFSEFMVNQTCLSIFRKIFCALGRQ